jgi:hypothetical protein
MADEGAVLGRKRKVLNAASRRTAKHHTKSKKQAQTSKQGRIASPVEQSSDDDLVIEVC